MATDLINRDQAARMLRAVVRDHPDLRNPEENGACLYTGPPEPGLGEVRRHCGVGQLLTDAGLPCPPYGSFENAEFFDSLPRRYLEAFAPEAARLISRCQQLFDARPDGDPPRLWGDPELVAQLERELS